MVSAKSIIALPFVLCWGLADACDTFTVSGRVSDQGSAVGTWVGVFEGALRYQAAPVGSIWVEAGEFELEVPCTEPVTLLAVRKGAVPLARQISGSLPTAVDLRFAPGLSLAGSVHSDENLPIGAASVSVTRTDTVGLRLPESLTTWRSSKDGTFVAGGLAPGRYRVVASADGHMPVELPEVVVGEGGANRVQLRLARAFFIGGRVVDTSGSPVAGAETRGEPSTSGGTTAETTVTSDSEGEFRLGPFGKAQEVLISARADLSRSDAAYYTAPMDNLVLTLRDAVAIRGSVSNAFTGELVNDFALTAYGRGESRSHAFADAAGEVSATVPGSTGEIVISAPGFAPWYTRVDFGSGGGKHDFGDIALEPERIVTGRVVDAASGLPVRAWVRRSFDRSDSPITLQFGPANRLAPAAWTNEEGGFRLSGLPRGDVRVETGSSGYAQAVVGVPAGTDYVDIEMAVASTIEGMLVTDEGTPAKGEVLLARVGGTAESRRVEKGNFAFEIAARANDQYRLLGRSDMGRVESRKLTIRYDNESVTGIQLVVRRLGRVSGLLAGLGTTEGASLIVVDGGGRQVKKTPWSLQTGHYSLAGVSEGRFTLRARTTSGRAIAREFESDGHGDTVVDLVFAGTSTLSGVVTAAGRPIPGIEVEATPRDESSTSGKGRTTTTGAYTIDGLNDGDYVVRVRGRSFGVELSRDTAYDVKLGPLTISGVVRAEGPILGALVTATPTSAAAGPGGSDRVDSRGSFRIDGLDEGEYAVRVSHPRHREFSRTIFLGSPIEKFDVYLFSSPTDGPGAEASAETAGS